MKKLKLFLQNLNTKTREENITEISNEFVKSITQTVLNDQKFTSVEMATIASNISVGVKSFLAARKEKLTSDLSDTEEALKNL